MSTSKQTHSMTLLYLDVTSSSEATIAVITASVDGEHYTWTGTAKKIPGDKFLPSIGRKLAIGRALASASRQLIKQGNGLVKSQDHNLAASKVAREKRETEGLKVHRVNRSHQRNR